MISSIRHKSLRRFHWEGNSSSIPPSHAERLHRILTRLDEANKPADMAYPGSGLHVLKGELGYWALSVSGNWRIIFRFKGSDVSDVGYLDYH